MKEQRCWSLHLRVENASLRFDNTDSPVIGVNVVQVSSGSDDRGELESQVLGMHLRRKGIAQTLLLPSRNLDAVLGGGQVANNAALLVVKIPQRAANKVDRNRRRLPVGDGDQRLGGLAIDELDAENLRGRE